MCVRVDVSINDVSSENMMSIGIRITKEIGKRYRRKIVVVVKFVLKNLHRAGMGIFTITFWREAVTREVCSIQFNAEILQHWRPSHVPHEDAGFMWTCDQVFSGLVAHWHF